MRVTDEGTATCRTCQTTKPVAAFFKLPYGGKGVRGVCKDCRRPTERDANLRRKYGITIEEYEALAARQGHRCAACGEHEEETGEAQHARGARRLGVDVDREGRVRGLLCSRCRLLVGALEDADLWAAAQAYIAAGGQVQP